MTLMVNRAGPACSDGIARLIAACSTPIAGSLPARHLCVARATSNPAAWATMVDVRPREAACFHLDGDRHRLGDMRALRRIDADDARGAGGGGGHDARRRLDRGRASSGCDCGDGSDATADAGTVSVRRRRAPRPPHSRSAPIAHIELIVQRRDHPRLERVRIARRERALRQRAHLVRDGIDDGYADDSRRSRHGSVSTGSTSPRIAMTIAAARSTRSRINVRPQGSRHCRPRTC